MLVVARAGKTKASALAHAEHQLGESKILGVVLNGAALASNLQKAAPARLSLSERAETTCPALEPRSGRLGR